MLNTQLHLNISAALKQRFQAQPSTPSLLSMLLIGLLLAVLAGCGSKPSQPLTERPLIEPGSIAERLDQIEYDLSAGHIDAAHSSLSQLDASSLDQAQQTRWLLLQVRVALAQTDGNRALQWLDSRYSQLLDQLPDERQTEISFMRIQALEFNKDYLTAARQRVFIAPILTSEEAEQNHEAIWQALLQVPLAELQNRQNQPALAEYQAWLKLAYINKNHQWHVDEQLLAIQQWRSQHPDHPAALQLPGGLQLLQSLVTQRPNRIALLLPLSGPLAKAGQAIRDGFMAAYFAAYGKNAQVPEIRILDAADNLDLLRLHQELANEGIELIIGPLNKTAIKQLQQAEGLAVPQLALNYGEPSLINPSNLYQFGLAAEDEARQVAEQAYQNGLRRAAAVIPESDWGARTFQAFAEHWQGLGGQLVGHQFYTGDNDYGQVLKRLLKVDASEQRRGDLQKLLRRPLAFPEQRRRQDVDWIFMLGNAQQARLLKPALAFYFAGDIPVYATSHIYSGFSNRKLDNDLSGIRFCDVPWLHEEFGLKDTINSLWQNAHKGYGRLYALGVDAFQLYPRLTYLAAIQGSRMYGATGSLHLNASRRVVRELVWLQMVNGRPRPLPAIKAASSAQPNNQAWSGSGANAGRRQQSPQDNYFNASGERPAQPQTPEPEAGLLSGW